MTTTPRDELERVLGPDIPALALLADDEVEWLLRTFKTAMVNQGEELFASIDVALGHLPKMLRGTARRIVFGKEAP